jgi:hypothetical protein
VKLKVRSAHDSDTYLDFARIPRDYRKNERHQPLGRGEVCRVFCVETGKEWFVILHGAPAKLGATIRIDEHVRQKLGVHRDEEYDFHLSQADLCGQIYWALHATDIRFRFPALISLVSVALGFGLGIIGIVISVLNR